MVICKLINTIIKFNKHCIVIDIYIYNLYIYIHTWQIVLHGLKNILLKHVTYVINNFCISQNPHFVWFWEIGQSHLASNSSNCCFRAVWSCATKKSRWTVPPTRYNAYLLIDLEEIVSMLRSHFRCFMVPFKTEVTIIWESLLCQHDIEETGVWSLLLAWKFKPQKVLWFWRLMCVPPQYVGFYGVSVAHVTIFWCFDRTWNLW